MVYTYAWSTQPWSSSHETWIADIARVAAFLYEESYSKATRLELNKIQRHSLLNIAAHEIKQLVMAVDEGLTKHYGELIRDYLQLHFELAIGDTFRRAFELLYTDLRASIKELAWISYLFRVICVDRPNRAKVDEIFFSNQKDKANELIRLDHSLPEIAVVNSNSDWKIILHFLAGFLAGLGNAIDYCRKDERIDPIIVINFDGGLIVIENTYISKMDDESDRMIFDIKRKNKVVGTEAVLQYHESMMFEYTSNVHSRIEKKECLNLDNEQFCHKWRTVFPIPNFGMNVDI